MKTIGITGNIGSGKSTVADFIANEWNIPAIDVDQLAKKVLNRNINKLMTFGKDIVVDEKINFDQLFEHVFRHPETIRKYNRWIHPLVITKLQEELGKLNSKLVVVNAPLIFETRFSTDYLILVHCSNGIRMTRIFQRHLIKEKTFIEAEKMYHRAQDLDKLQFPGEIIANYSDYVISNDGVFNPDTAIQIASVMGEILWKVKGAKK